MIFVSYLIGVTSDYTVHMILTGSLEGMLTITPFTILNVTTHPFSGRLVLLLTQYFNIYHLNITLTLDIKAWHSLKMSWSKALSNWLIHVSLSQLLLLIAF